RSTDGMGDGLYRVAIRRLAVFHRETDLVGRIVAEGGPDERIFRGASANDLIADVDQSGRLGRGLDDDGEVLAEAFKERQRVLLAPLFCAGVLVRGIAVLLDAHGDDRLRLLGDGPQDFRVSVQKVLIDWGVAAAQADPNPAQTDAPRIPGSVSHAGNVVLID